MTAAPQPPPQRMGGFDLMKHWKKALIALVLAALFAAPAATAKPYTFFVPISEGLSMGSLSNLLREMGKTAEEKTGIEIEVVDYTYQKGEKVRHKVVDMFQNNNADFGYMFAQDFIKYAKTGDNTIVPMFTITLFNKPYSEFCFYTRKDENHESLEDMQGLIWGGAHTVAARYILYKNGIDEPLDEFFSNMVFINDSDTAAMMDALLDHQIDVAVMASFQTGMVTANNKKYNALAETHCTEYEHNWVFVRHRDLPKDLVNTIKKTFLRAHKDRDFAKFHFIMQAIQGHFVDIDIKDLKTTKEIVDLAEEHGWYEEEEEFIEKQK